MGIRLIVVVMLVILTVCKADADVIELKNGQKVEGILKQADQSTVTVEIGGQILTFKADQVKAIYYGPAPTTAATASATGPTTDALRALKDLQSAARVGVVFDEYRRRVTDATIIVDRFLEDATAAADAKSAMRAAIDFYQAAVHLWTFKLQGRSAVSPEIVNLQFRGDAALLNQCPKTQVAQGIIDLTGNLGGDPFSALWACASERIETATIALGVR